MQLRAVDAALAAVTIHVVAAVMCKDVWISLLDVAFRHTRPDFNCSICLSVDSQFPAHSHAIALAYMPIRFQITANETESVS